MSNLHELGMRAATDRVASRNVATRRLVGAMIWTAASTVVVACATDDVPSPQKEDPRDATLDVPADATSNARDASDTRDASGTDRDASAADASVVDADADAGVCAPGEFKEESCATCGARRAPCVDGIWGAFGACRGDCADAGDAGDAGDAAVEPPLEPALVLAAQSGASAESVFTLTGARLKTLATSSAAPCGVSDTVAPSTLIRVDNPTAAATRVELRVGRAPDEFQVDVVIAAYATRPAEDDAARAACLTGAEGNCFADFDFLSCLIGTDAVTVPANGSVWVYVGDNSGFDDTSPFLFRATRLD